MSIKLVTTTEAAEVLGVKTNTLEGWRVRGEGPPYRKIGRLVKYVESDLLAFIEGSKRQSTSQAAA